MDEPTVQEWVSFGVTHLWLMGVWRVGEGAVHHAKSLRAANASGPSPIPGPSDLVCGSPYAIADYQVDETLGGNDGLQCFRALLHRHGIRLILDFVPNHVSLDHPWVRHRPEWFVGSDHPRPGTFPVSEGTKVRWIAHGKDPYFAPWGDTAQVDWRLEEVHRVMQLELAAIAEKCDGVRADMAMLPLHDRFRNQWQSFPLGGHETHEEFWPTAIAAIRHRYPDFLFLAEAYWDLEPELLRMGFDFAYDKRAYDFLIDRRYSEFKIHLRARHSDLWLRGARFLENHDERRIASITSGSEHRAWAVALLGLPGLRLLHEGQLEGVQDRADIRTLFRSFAKSDPDLARFYQEWLPILKRLGVGRGQPHLLDAYPVDQPRDRLDQVMVWAWSNDSSEVIVGCTHLQEGRVQVRIPLPVVACHPRAWEGTRMWGTQMRSPTVQVEGSSLCVVLESWEAQVFRLRGLLGDGDGGVLGADKETERRS